MSRIISDQAAQKAFDWLHEQAGPAAAARANRERREYALKQVKARAFLQCKGTVAEKEASAILTPEYEQALDEYVQAVQEDEEYRNNRSKCDAIIQAWQSCNANERAYRRV
jgi:hypothetical protein